MTLWSRCSRRWMFVLFFLIFLVVVEGNDDFEALRNAKVASGLVGGRCIGMICRDGALLLSSTKEDLSSRGKGITRQVCQSSQDRVHRIDESIAVSMSGLSVDCNFVCKLLKQAARTHRDSFGVRISMSQLAEHISTELHDQTK